MKFLCLAYYDLEKFEAMSQEELETFASECRPHDEALRKTGKVTAQGSFTLPHDWKSVRAENGTPVVSDGPYLRANELAGAFFIVEANDLDEAVQVASKHPGAHLSKYAGGGIEVRACEIFEQA